MIALIVSSLIEGVALALISLVVLKKKVSTNSVGMLAVMIGLVLLVLDMFSPRTADGARQGAGLGLGVKLLGVL